MPRSCERAYGLPQSKGFAAVLGLLFSLLPAPCSLLHAGPRTSASYSITTDTADNGGGTTSSAAYSIDSSTTVMTGISNVAAPAEVAKHGFIGQLTDMAALAITSATASLNETATLQLAAWQVLDDDTFNAVLATDAVWSVPSGPLTSINAGGLATAGTVYDDTAAVAQATFAGFISTLNLTVLDSIADNYGTYTADGLPDDWQVQHFGIGNPNAGKNANPDSDGYNNLIEFAFGTDPMNGGSGPGSIAYAAGLITQRGQPAVSVQNITNGVDFRAAFGRRKDYLASGLTYQVQFSGDLTTWQTSTATPTIVASQGEMDAVTVPYPFFVNGKKARFFRVNVSQQ